MTSADIITQDLDSGHHGSGFPLPPFRQALLERRLASLEAAGLLRKTPAKKKTAEPEHPDPEGAVYFRRSNGRILSCCLADSARTLGSVL